MAYDYNKKAFDAVVEASHFDPDDILAFGKNYFSCGWGKEQYYNHSLAIAIALIGTKYGDNTSGRSAYHSGIVFISKELGITKRQIKVLRKKMKYKGGFGFRTPYNIATTVRKIIELLRAKENDLDVQCYISQQISDMYREFLIGTQFESVKEAAKKGKRDKVKAVASELKALTMKVGE